MKTTDCTQYAKVWHFAYAPKHLQALSTNGGDEDYLVELPPAMNQFGCPGWIERMETCGEPQCYPHPDKEGWTVYISSH